MAQLPPKVPNMTQNWHNYFVDGSNHHHHQSSWVDEFLNFSSARRGAHRRFISDSIAFLEQPLVEDCRYSNNNNNAMMSLDDEQLMSMFSDDVAVTMASVPTVSSSTSDQNSNNDEKPVPSLDLQQPKNEPAEVESSCEAEPQAAQPPSNSNGDTIVDPKRVKRILANRQSAQRSRVRKLQYISELERSVSTLQSEVSALSPRVAFLDHQRLILNVDNSALKQRIAALAQDKIFKDAHQEALKKEIERLRQVYQQQQSLKKMNNNDNNNDNHHAPPQKQPSQPPENEERLMS
ncbi:Basic leucine zipper 61 [Hibiscus syriacus]|uniref:Basic leucine zipper 61 n=1 Tax=Hibiscus syriacus TaxID=106335 RepID=A0A6A2Y6L3_HIBSY|nr:basic leucine zipper 61-like [Hibiscus syriacus]KAE8680120.1 Basic leucine zipper 61 [Hibiscus syriacus]